MQLDGKSKSWLLHVRLLTSRRGASQRAIMRIADPLLSGALVPSRHLMQ